MKYPCPFYLFFKGYQHMFPGSFRESLLNKLCFISFHSFFALFLHLYHIISISCKDTNKSVHWGISRIVIHLFLFPPSFIQYLHSGWSFLLVQNWITDTQEVCVAFLTILQCIHMNKQQKKRKNLMLKQVCPHYL